MSEELNLTVLQQAIAEQYPEIVLTAMSPAELVFETRVTMSCFYCKNYDRNWHCPPRTPKIDYQHMMLEYGRGAFALISLPFDENNFSEIRARSTNDLHQALLKLEKVLWDHDFPMALSFIGGSCKLCKNGCGTERCNHPYQARMPLEATGVNVIESAKKYGIELHFPPKTVLKRLGLLLW